MNKKADIESLEVIDTIQEEIRNQHALLEQTLSTANYNKTSIIELQDEVTGLSKFVREKSDTLEEEVNNLDKGKASYDEFDTIKK